MITFEQFQKSGKDHADLGAKMGDFDGAHLLGQPGRLYDSRLFLLRYDSPEGRWCLQIGSVETVSNDLGALERGLYDFGLSEDYFAEVRPTDMPALPEGWSDISSPNDGAPSYLSADGTLQVFLLSATLAERETGLAEMKRFIVTLHPEPTEDILQTDDWAEVLAYVAGAAK